MKNLIKEETKSLNASNTDVILSNENSVQGGKEDYKFEEEKIIAASFTQDSKEEKSLESTKDIEDSLQIYKIQESQQNENVTNFEDTNIISENFTHKNNESKIKEDESQFQENLEDRETIILSNNTDEKEEISKDCCDQEDKRIDAQKDKIEKEEEEERNLSFGKDPKKVLILSFKVIFTYNLGRT